VRPRWQSINRHSIERNVIFVAAWELILAENLIEHNLHMVARVPICVMVKAAILLQYAVQLDTARAHELDVSLR
jgi:hypothetical protein